MPRPWSIHSKRFSPTAERLLTHMIPETAEAEPEAVTAALDTIAAAVVTIAKAVESVAGPVQVITSGNVARGAAPFVSIMVLPQPDASAEDASA